MTESEVEPESSTWLVLHPHDTVTVRDGRSFDAGSVRDADAVVPPPSTTAGAISAAYGGRQLNCLRGGLPATFHPEGFEAPGVTLWFPTPLGLSVGKDGELVRLRPRMAEEGSSDLELRMLHGQGVRVADEVEVEPLGGFIDRVLLGTFLRDGSLDGRRVWPRRHRDESRLWVTESHTGIALAGKPAGPRTAIDGMLYARKHLRPRAKDLQSVGWAVEVDGAPEAQSAWHVRLGGQGRQVDVRPASNGLGLTPAAPESYPYGRVLVYLATPGLFTNGWCFELPAECELVSAAVDRVAIARWDGYDWAAAPGSTYYLQFADEVTALTWARDRHWASLSAEDNAFAFMGTAGFGVALMGTWSPWEGSE